MAHNYLILAGTGGGASTPDTADLDIVDYHVEAYIRATDYTPSAIMHVISRRHASAGKPPSLEIGTNGVLALRDGSLYRPSTVGTGLTDDTDQWVKATWDADDGGDNDVAKFYLGGATGTPSYSQLGSTVTTATAVTLNVGTNALWVGRSVNGGNYFTGRIYEAVMYDAIDGSVIAHFNADDFSHNDVSGATATGADSRVWTLAGDAIIFDPDVTIAGMLLLGVG